MPTISSRLTNTGTLLVNGSFDEVTFNSSLPTIKNQFTYSQNFDNAIWTKSTATVSANAAVAPDGANTAYKLNLTAVSSQFYINQDTNLTLGSVYTQSMYAKAGEQSILQITPSTGFNYGTNYVNFNLSAGNIQTQVGTDVATITSVGNGWYRCTYTQAATQTISGRMLFALTGGNPGRIPTFVGNVGQGIYIWGAQLETSSNATVYQPTAATGTIISSSVTKQTVDSIYTSGSFDEVTFNATAPAINNLLIYSQNLEAMSVTGWFGANITNNSVYVITNATTSPDRDNTGQKLYSAPASAGSVIQRAYRTVTFTSGQTYTFSVFAKAAEYSTFWTYVEPASGRIGIVANLTANTVSIYSGSPTNLFLTSVGNGWYRTGFTWTAPATETVPANAMRLIDNAGQSTFTGDGSSGIFIWGSQLENNNSATIYQPIAAANTLVASNTARKIDNQGGYYVQREFDEFTGAPIIDGNLALWLDPTQISSYSGSGNTWVDLSTSTNTATLSGATFDNISGGGSITFSGTAFASLANLIVPTGSRTIVMAFRTSNLAARSGLISIRDSSGGWFITVNRTGSGSIDYVHNNTTPDTIASGAITATDAWNILTTTYDVTTNIGNIYVNNVLKGGPTTMSAIQATSIIQPTIAKEQNSQTLQGQVGDVLVYSRAFTADEVAQTFAALRSRYGI